MNMPQAFRPKWTILFGFIALLLATAMTSAWGQEATQDAVETRRERLLEISDEIAQADEETLIELREAVRSIRLEAEAAAEPLRIRIDEINADLEQLEPVGEDQPEPTADLREPLQEELDQLTAIASQAELNVAEARRLLSDIDARRRTAFGVAEAAVEIQRQRLVDVSSEISEANEETLIEFREEVRAIRLEAEATAEPLRTRIDELNADLERLGPVEEDESLLVADIRQPLQAELDRLTAIVSQAELNVTEAGRLLSDIGTRRRDAFYERVLERDRPPFTFESINTAFSTIGVDWTTFWSRYTQWREAFDAPEDFRAAVWGLVFSGFLALLLLWPIPRWADRQLLERFQSYDPTAPRRAALAALRVLSRALPALIGATLVYQTAAANGVVTETTSRLVGSLLLAISTVFVVEDVASAVFAPKQPKWRVFPLESERARGVRILLVLIVIVFSSNFVMNRLMDWLGASRELVTVVSALIMVVGGVLFFVIVRPRLWQLNEAGRASISPEALSFWRWTRSLAGVMAVLSIFAILVGYIALGRFVLTRMYFLAFLLTAAWMARALLGELADRAGERVSRSMSGGEISNEGEQEDDKRLLAFWLRLLIDLVVFVTVLPIALLLLGAEWADMRNWLFDALFGLEIGGFTISLVNVFSAIAAIVVITIITRFVQRTIDTRIFEPAGMESGLRNTFRTLIGYAGLVIGLMVAIATLGFPLANLAIVAGALSLGIGFGLQSIVNNFVSGLILLFERPIKVGDWIVTTAGEGIVKRISVRSTEIETFDWASVIVPNSELITAPVTNWTHKNRYTRLIVRVGVTYSSDPKEVAQLLLKEAKANRRTLSFPAPVVYFAGYGDSSLDFEVRIFINNVDDRIPVQNELRIAIFDALKEAGIEIPFPQRDLHVRSIEPGTILAGNRDPEPVAVEAEEPPVADEAEESDATPHQVPPEES